MRKVRMQQSCRACGSTFEVRPNEVGRIVTCSKACSLLYRSMNFSGRKITWTDKISAALKGRKCEWTRTPEYREAMSKVMRGKPGPIPKGSKLPQAWRQKMSDAHKGHHRGGWKLSVKTRQLMSDSRKGERSHFWRGGITPENRLIRTTAEYGAWRESVFGRDDYACQICGKRGVVLHAHHIRPFAEFPDLRFEVSNGQTLCLPCHRFVHFGLRGDDVVRVTSK